MNQVDRIFERVAVGRPSAGDLDFLRATVTRGPGADIFIVDDRHQVVDHGTYFQIGGRFYYGLDAIRIRLAMATAVGDQAPQHPGSRVAGGCGRLLRAAGILAVVVGLALLALTFTPVWQAIVVYDLARLSELTRSGSTTLTAGLAASAIGTLLIRAGKALCQAGPDGAPPLKASGPHEGGARAHQH